jgi:TatD DNase family protein
MPLFDTHAHLDDDQFSDVAKIIDQAREAGVEQIVAIGTTAESSRACVEIAHRFDGIYAAVGIQPNYTHEVQDGDWQQINDLANDAKVVAIGETGLDHYWDYAELGIQRDFFRRHMRLALDTQKPLVIHMRDPKVEKGEPPSDRCAQEIYSELSQFAAGSPVSGIMHSYTGDGEMAARFLELGLHISFAGMVTFKNSHELRAVAKQIPDDRILIETDSPYLSPHPARGTRPNSPALMTHTANCLSEVRATPYEAFVTQTTQNARKLFQVASA